MLYTEMNFLHIFLHGLLQKSETHWVKYTYLFCTIMVGKKKIKEIADAVFNVDSCFIGKGYFLHMSLHGHLD